MKSVLALLNKQTFTVNQIIVIVSVYLVSVFNIPFFSKTLTAVTSLDEYNIFFLLSVPVFLLSLIIILASLFSLKWLLKPALALLIFISSVVFYATVTYGIVFDYDMIQNVFETYTAEAFSYLNWYAVVFVFVVGVLPISWLLMISVQFSSFGRELFQRVKLVSSAFAAIAIIAYFFYSNYASIGRNNRDLVKYIVPLKPVEATVKYVKNTYFSDPLVFDVVDSSPKNVTPSGLKNVTVLVLGETARAKNFSRNGYDKPTNQYTDRFFPTYFNNMHSCGTATAVSVPCMFSLLSHDNYDKRKAVRQQNLLDIIQLSGVDVLWVDNNDGCKGVCKRVPTIEIDVSSRNPLCDDDYCFDEALLGPLKEKLSALKQPSTLIVLHMIGSHGPTYYRRYPREHAKFLPDCPRSDIQNCSPQELINTYDNTIVYSDFVLSKVMEQLTVLATEQSHTNVSMLYISDHGESLGEHGVYLHGLPYTFAPAEQTDIPMLYWRAASNTSMNNECVESLSSNRYSHDNIFHSMLGLLGVQSSVYNEDYDLFSHCETHSVVAQLNLDNKGSKATN